MRTADLVAVAKFLKEDPALAFDMIIDVCGVDRFRDEERFEVIYNLYSLTHKKYLRLKVLVNEDNPLVPSVTGIWSGANWHERETHDFFGIRFLGHPDLTPFLLPEDADFHPLRKDYAT